MLRVPGDVMMWRVSPYPLACLVSKWLRGITTQVTLISAQRFLLRQNVHLRPRKQLVSLLKRCLSKRRARRWRCSVESGCPLSAFSSKAF